MELGLGSIAFIYDFIKSGKYSSSSDLLLNSVEKAFHFAEENDLAICEVNLDPPEILLSEERQKFIDICNSFPKIKKQFHAPYAYLSLCARNPWIIQASIECYTKCADLCKEIGANLFTLHPGEAKFLHHSYNTIKNQLVESVEMLLDEIDGMALITCIENMPKFTGFFLNVDEINDFYSTINRNDAYFTWDTGHSWSCYDDVEELWKNQHKRTKNIHLVENLENTLDIHPTLGTGDVDFQKVFALADMYDYNGAMIMELHRVEDLQPSIEFIRQFY